MAHLGKKILLFGLICAAFSVRSVQAEDAKAVSYVIFAPGQSDKTAQALAELFSKNNPIASVSHVNTLPEAIASKSDIAVLALSVAEFNALGPYDADALKTRKVIGIGFGAAKLFGEIGLKISQGSCAHGMEPRICIENNTMVAKEGFGNAFGVYTSNVQQYPNGDVEYMPFGIFTGYPTLHPGLEELDVVARFVNDRGYAPIVRQGNKILIGFNPHAEEWSDSFCDLMGKLALALNEPVKNRLEKPAAAAAGKSMEGDWASADQDSRGKMRLRIAKDTNDWTIQAWASGDGGKSEIPWQATHLDRLGESVGATELPYGFATWDFGFKLTHLTARPEKDELVVEMFNIFKDNSGRSNYRTVENFKKDMHSASDGDASQKK